MDNREAAYRIRLAADASSHIRKMASGPPRSARVTPGGARNDQQRIALLEQQVDALGTALSELARYVALRDGVDLGDSTPKE